MKSKICTDLKHPFGTFDSELAYQEINIPDGFQATIEDRKIILKKRGITMAREEKCMEGGNNYG